LIEGLAHDGDLAVHHPGGADHVNARGCLSDRHVGVAGERRVVVDASRRVSTPQVAVRGELVQAEIAHHHRGVAHFGDDVTDRDVEDPLRIGSARADLVTRGRHAEQHDAADAGPDRLGRRLAKGLTRVLYDAGE